MNYKNDINDLIQDLKTTASEKLDARIYSAINKSLPQAEEPDIWRIFMKRNIAKFATCITVLIIAVLTVIHFSGGKIDIATPVFADVMETIYKAKNVAYMQTIATSRGDLTTKNIATDAGFLRTETQFNTIMIFDHVNGIQMTLHPEMKKCYKLYRKKGVKRLGRPFTWLEWIQKMHRKAAEYSHSEVLDEKDTDVFLIEAPFEKTTIWVDPQTDLPVKIVMEQFQNKEVEGGLPKLVLKESDFGGSPNVSSSQGFYGARNGLGFSEENTVTMTDFVWDSELDSSLFTFDPPDDWEVVENKQPNPEIDKEGLINALAFWTEMSDGKFPDKINDLMDPELLNPLLIKKYNIGGDPDEQFEQANKQGNIVLTGLIFTKEKMLNNNWHYAGAGVTFGDKDTPIAWWQNDEDVTWTIIYADLNIDEAAEEPPL